VTPTNANARLETFCDGVFAFALTLLIIDIKLPRDASFTTSAELWRALGALTPGVLAFLLSFTIIFITWVNHHAVLQSVRGSSPTFFYANGVLLLTVVGIPFTTSLLGAFAGTDHAAPAVVVYDAALVVQAGAWLLVTKAALTGGLVEGSVARKKWGPGYGGGGGGVGFYGVLAVLAFWAPNGVAAVTLISWIFWLVLSIRSEEGAV
jgi:uncharacterized membrane protein